VATVVQPVSCRYSTPPRGANAPMLTLRCTDRDYRRFAAADRPTSSACSKYPSTSCTTRSSAAPGAPVELRRCCLGMFWNYELDVFPRLACITLPLMLACILLYISHVMGSSEKTLVSRNWSQQLATLSYDGLIISRDMPTAIQLCQTLVQCCSWWAMSRPAGRSVR
jgi:hypothetical protein